MNTPNLPLETLLADTSTPADWLGSFWTTVYEAPELVSSYMTSRGILSSQLWVGILETIGLLDRKNLPVCHRERWYPIQLRQSEQGTGKASSLTLGMQPLPRLGMQDPGIFPRSSMFQLGGTARYSKYNVYPIPAGIVDIRTALTNGLVNPSMTLRPNEDYVIQGESLVIRKEADPFARSEFVKTLISTEDGTDNLVTLWGCDVLFDKDYVYNYLGYVLGARTRSTDECKRILNALWDATTDGVTRTALTEFIGALYGVPTVRTDGEVVEQIVTETTGDQVVITNVSTYRLPSNAVVSVVLGDVLAATTFLDSSIAIYTNVTDPSPLVMAKRAAGTEFRQRITHVTLPASYFRAPLSAGLTATWLPVPIYNAGDDANGNPRLWFPLDGNSADVTAYWEDVWKYCLDNNISTETCFSGLVSGIVDPAPGSICGYVEPLDYWLRNVLGTNSVLVSVDRTQLSALGRRNFDAGLADKLKDVLPAYVRLFVIEKVAKGPEQYGLDTETTSSPYAICWSSNTSSYGVAGRPNRARLSCQDRKPVIRWVAVCK